MDRSRISHMDGISEADEYDEEEEEDSSSDDYDDEEDRIADMADEFAAGYEELLFNAQKSAEQINYDHYHFSVSQKYDLKNRNLCTKKFKYILDEVFLDLHPRMWRSIQFKTSILFIIFLGYLRMFTHYTFQYVVLNMLGVPVTAFKMGWWKIELNYAAYELF